MKARRHPSGPETAWRLRLHSEILTDPAFGKWFVDICTGRQPRRQISDEMAALAEGVGLVRHSAFGWVLAADGRQYARDLGLIRGPTSAEIDVAARPQPDSARPYERPDELAEAWRLFKERPDENLRDALVAQYFYLVQGAVQVVQEKLAVRVDTDDLVAAGLLALVDAFDAFDPESPEAFQDYCMPRIRSAVLAELRNWGGRPVHPGATERAGIAARLALCHPDDDHLFVDPGGDEGQRGPQLKSTSRKPAAHAQRADEYLADAQREAIRQAITQTLTRDERIILALYYSEGVTMRSIASTLGISECRVSQIHSRILNRLRARLRESLTKPD